MLNAAWLGGGAGCGQAGGARLRGPGRWKIMCSNFVQAVAVLAAVREGEGAVHCRQSIQLAPPPANRDGNQPSRSSTVPGSEGMGGLVIIDSSSLPSIMIFALVSQFENYLPCLGTSQCLK